MDGAVGDHGHAAAGGVRTRLTLGVDAAAAARDRGMGRDVDRDIAGALAVLIGGDAVLGTGDGGAGSVIHRNVAVAVAVGVDAVAGCGGYVAVVVDGHRAV